MKKLMNRPESVVDEMLEGMAALYPGLVRLSQHNVLMQAGLVQSDLARTGLARSEAPEPRDRQVALISGGGSGHEPAHAGYVGEGMLSAAVAGDVFTSPSVDSVFAAIQAVAGKPGALLIVKNYTGDRLNFGLAAEMARAEGIPVRMVIVADDVALRDRLEMAEARGLAGVVLIHKLAGAAAAQGRSLDEVYAIAQAAAANMGTMGVSLSAGTSPTVGKPSFTLGDEEIELGLGIHGEPGASRMPLPSADQLTDTLIESIVSALGFDLGERLAVLVNNLGATTEMELAIIARRALANLANRGFKVERLYSGSFLTSLDTAGISLSILSVDDRRLAGLDAPTSAPAWPNVSRKRPTPVEDRVWASATPLSQASGPQQPPQSAQGKLAGQAIRAACAALLQAEPQLTEMDRLVGDGDLGISMARGAKAVEQALASYPLDDLPKTLQRLAHTLRAKLGGASGPLYGVLFMRSGSVLEQSDAHDLKDWAEAMAGACDAVSELGGAKAGDRTMLDALIPFAQTLSREAASGKTMKEALKHAAEAAAKGAEETAQMLPRRGRSSHLGERALGHPDPGAVAVSLWLNAVVRTLIEGLL